MKGSDRLGNLIDMVNQGKLILRPPFQRRQVWANKDKELLIDTVLKEYPFPEIFVCNGEKIPNSPARKLWLVDGQQRITTLVDYRNGEGTLYRTVKKFAELSQEVQDRFDEYPVAVRDLGVRGEKEIREIFRRINATDFSLKSMEILNALFSGEYQQFCLSLSNHDFFDRHKTFRPGDKRRMQDVTFCVTLVTTILSTYYRRDEQNAEYLERYNEAFDQKEKVMLGLDRTFAFVDDCGFTTDCRVWKQTDLFTLLVEAHDLVVRLGLSLDTKACGARLSAFYDKVNDLYKQKPNLDEERGNDLVFKYMKAAVKASGDKYTRIARGEVVEELLRLTLGTSEPEELRPIPKTSRRRSSKNK